jgi:hypothetical protein
MGLERGPLSLIRITEELFQGNSGRSVIIVRLLTQATEFFFKFLIRMLKFQIKNISHMIISKFRHTGSLIR